MSSCLFCRIAAGEIPAQKLYEDSDVVAFRDIAPQAPVHFLVIPRRHIASVLDMQPGDEDLLAKILSVAAKLSHEQGVGGSGCRMVFNSKEDGGQSVDHVHLHVLGGRPLSWPPG